jgi:hypothetical protein
VETEDSGKLKKEHHLSDNNDRIVNSAIEYFYKNNRLAKKDYIDNSWNYPYILQKDTFIYNAGKLSQMVHYFRTSATSPLKISKIHNYFYFDTDSTIEVIHFNSGELKDSILYVYSNGLLIEKRHHYHGRIWGKKYEYNSDNKLYKSADINKNNYVINYFDENGVLKSSGNFRNDVLMAAINYERQINGNQLTIKMYINNFSINTIGKVLSSYKVFENRKLIEYVVYRTNSEVTEKWYTGYEYF